MTIQGFLKEHIEAMQQIITDLPQTFDSHQFLERFEHHFESDYNAFLHQYQNPTDEHDAFQKVHGQIAWFLSKKATTLGITKTHRVNTPNVFGNKTANQGWRKL